MCNENENENYFNDYTKEEFHQQDFNWLDKNFDYAVHVTDGGAIYLMQKDIDFGSEYELRLDGADLDQLIDTLQKIKNKEYDLIDL